MPLCQIGTGQEQLVISRKENQVLQAQLADKQEYLVHAELQSFRQKVQRTIEDIQASLAPYERVGVSFSTGKDSLVMLDLLMTSIDRNKLTVCFYDSGAEYPDSLTMLDEIESLYNCEIQIIEPILSIWEFHQMNGAFGYRGELWKGKSYFTAEGDLKKMLIQDPARFAKDEFDLQVQAIGLRAEESKSRTQLLKNGKMQYWTYTGMYQYFPVAHWSGADIWAYITSKKLPYNKIYDKLFYSDKNPETQRVGSYLGTTNLNEGRISFLKHYYPELFNKVCATFPLLATYT